MLRSGSSAADPAKRDSDMDTSSEFLSLPRAQKKSARLQKGLDDSYSSTGTSPANVSFSLRHERGVGFFWNFTLLFFNVHTNLIIS